MKNVKKILISSLAWVMVLFCAGCNNPTDPKNTEPVNIAFVVGIADGETKINEGIEELSTLSARPGTDFAFISVEDIPSCIGEPGTITDQSDKGYTDTMMKRVKAGIKADLVERLESYKPSSVELDIAAATDLAVRNLNANAIDDRPNILVFYCSGKSTAGLINMIETPIYKLDIEASVPTIAKKMNLDMSNIDEIIWYCCGDLGGDEQPALSTNEKVQMKKFYEQLFNTMGAKKVTFKNNLPSKEYYRFEDKPVSCMDVEGTVSGLKELDPEIFDEAEDTVIKKAPIVIPESKVSYKPDTAEFVNEEAAQAVIQPVTDFLLKHPNVNILLYSTCAGDIDTNVTLKLSKARSENVKSILVASGIDESRITVVTVKVADDPYYSYNRGTGPKGSVNRKSVIVDMSSDLAKQILANAQ